MSADFSTLVRYEPDHVLPPGEHLAAKLNELGMTQADLALRTQLSRKHVSQLVNGEAPLSTDVAARLERVTGVPAQLWNRLEANYRTWTTRQAESDHLSSSEAAVWAHHLPIDELTKRGHLQPGLSGPALVRDLLQFFGVASVGAWEAVVDERIAAAAYRPGDGATRTTAAVATWLRVCERRASQINCDPYDRNELGRLMAQVRHYSVGEPEDWWPRLVEQFASVGVALVLEPEFPGDTQLNGSSWWHTKDKAIVALSGRRKKADGLFFTLVHECVHVRRHSKKRTFIEFNEGAIGVDEQLEAEADQIAQRLLIHPDEWERISRIPDNNQAFPRIRNAARDIGVHPGIIVGQLQTRVWRNYGRGNRLKQTLDLSRDFWTRPT